MYNENIKNRYIEDKESQVVITKGYLKKCFEKSEAFERELDKDISNFTKPEIFNYFRTLNYSSFETLLVLCNTYQMYTQWCLQQNLVKDSQNHFLEFTKDDLISCINKVMLENKLIKRKQLIRWCNELVNPGDAFTLVALFEGLKGQNYKEIIEAKIENLDFDKREFTTVTGRVVPVSDLFIDLAVSTDKELNYSAITGQEQKEIKLIDNGNILKDYPNVKDGVSEFVKGRRLYNRGFRIFDFLGIGEWCTFNMIYGSGLVDFICSEAEKYSVSLDEYLATESMRQAAENKYGQKIQKYKIYQRYPFLFDN